MANIGKNIKLARQRKKLTQDELAEMLFVTRQTISNYELGKTQPDVEMLLSIAQALDTDMETLIHGHPAETAGNGKRLLVQSALLLVLSVAYRLFRKIIAAKAAAFVGAPLMYWNGLLVRPGIWLLQGMILLEALACLTKLAPKTAPRVRLALWVLVGVYLAAIAPVLLIPGTPGLHMELAYLLLATAPGYAALRAAFLLLGAALWLFRPAPPRGQSST